MQIRRCVALQALVVLLIASAASAQVDWSLLALGDRILITLNNGDVLRGVCTAREGGQLIVEHPLLGSLQIEEQSIKALVIEGAAPASPGPVATDLAPTGANDQIDEVLDVDPGQWKSVIDVGLTGSKGNTDKSNTRLRFGATYMSQLREFDSYVLYLYSAEDGEETQNRAELSARQEWLLPDRPWRVFRGCPSECVRPQCVDLGRTPEPGAS